MIKTYGVVIKTIGPVHIGCGETLKKQDYIYDYHESTVHYVDGPKLIKYLKNKGVLDKYLSFMRKPPKGHPREAELKTFLNSVKISKQDWSHFIDFSIPVNQGKKNSSNKSKPLNDITLMIRDGQKSVYIPGSTLKGAIKTALLAIQNNADDKRLYSKLKVSDSLPIENSSLAIYEKIDVNKTDKPMPLYRECIDIGTEINTTITIEDDAFSIKEIEDAIKYFFDNYQKKWLDGFTHSAIARKVLKETMPNKNNIVYLGGGPGFVSKTLQYQLYSIDKAKEEIFNVLSRRFKWSYGKFKSIPKNVPIALKVTHNQKEQKWYQQGMCEISFYQTEKEKE
ncbi:CRISPR-associated protein Csm5 [Staphylococcus microti]|uniref:CRISPR system Cms protein Csm5 n=1 Tax=Staphylococcus microti TaxID=569857 RepID=A0A0D6XSJ5_9STAP|nr:type III-A CRISPR-associated RAMP protein Csm5 [Staphylococcus microti]KIX91211.1 CRISPR-associated protein Csm5 [Staphylococcus microti]PNZ79922.1 type III-A CRISPR-associated RAMP protein Csm5 [Staphylococcus microti]SUM56462.1 Csm5 family CRISPR-associated RAMP protein [Staphylococcus microti]